MPRGVPATKFLQDCKNKEIRKIKLKKGCEYLTAGQAAEMLGVTRNEATALARGGHFEGAFKIGTYWRIPVFPPAQGEAQTI